MRRDTAAQADAMLDLAPASGYSWPTRGSMDMFLPSASGSLASIRLLSNRSVNRRWRRFPPSSGLASAAADNPQTRDVRWRPAWPNHRRVGSSCLRWRWRPPRPDRTSV